MCVRSVERRSAASLVSLAQNKPRALGSEHLVRSHALDPEPNASIRNLDLLRRGRSYLVCYDGMSVCERVRYQVIVCYEKKCVDRCRLIALTRGPSADRTQCREQVSVRFQKEVLSAIRGPICKLIGYSQNRVANFLDAEYL